MDLIGQGEFIGDGQAITQTRTVRNPREAPAYTFGYNHPQHAQRVHDVCQMLEQMALGKDSFLRAVIALDGTAPIAAAALALTKPGTVKAAVLDTHGFRFAALTDWRDSNFLPGGAKYGDLPGLLALGAPRKLFLMGEGKLPPDLVTAAYESAGVPDTLRVSEERDLNAAVKWLIEALK